MRSSSATGTPSGACACATAGPFCWCCSSANRATIPGWRCAFLTYPGLRYEELVRNEAPEVLAGRLPAALPVVLYNGANPWQAAREVGALIAPVGPRLDPFQPAQRTPILLP